MRKTVVDRFYFLLNPKDTRFRNSSQSPCEFTDPNVFPNQKRHDDAISLLIGGDFHVQPQTRESFLISGFLEQTKAFETCISV